MGADLFEYDGVGVAMRDGILLVIYGADARLHRTAWIFDRAEEVIERAGYIYCLLVIDTTKALPDAATRAENAVRFGKLRDKVRLFITVPLGDPLRSILVKAILRAIALILRDPGRHHLANTESDGLDALQQAIGANAPSKEELEDDLLGIRELLRGSSTVRSLRAV
jgi:hypothetical protein